MTRNVDTLEYITVAIMYVALFYLSYTSKPSIEYPNAPSMMSIFILAHIAMIGMIAFVMIYDKYNTE